MGSLSAGDFILRNLTTNAVVASEEIQLGYGEAHTITLTFPRSTGGSLADGDYVVTLKAARGDGSCG